MSLYQDYRPKNFGEIVGNKTTINTIKNKIYGEDPPHAIILHGPRGCGKTTIARIISEELGCKIKSNDFVELDAVQTGGIDTAREVRQNMNFLPMESKCRVWLIDEAQDASGKFQAGLLKALESGPAHCYFIWCTTDLSKIITTVKSRCTQWKVNLLKDSQIEKLIAWVLKGEEFTIDQKIIDEIIAASEGCPREALVTLDQIIDLEPDKMINAIQQTKADRESKELCQALLKKESWPRLATIIKGLDPSNPESIRRAVIGYMANVALDKQGYNKGNKERWEGVAVRAALVFDCFEKPVFYTGMGGITFAAYNTTL